MKIHPDIDIVNAYRAQGYGTIAAKWAAQKDVLRKRIENARNVFQLKQILLDILDTPGIMNG